MVLIDSVAVEIWDQIGLAGMSLVFIAYFLNYQKYIKRNSRLYDFLNLFGALFLVYNAISIKALAFLILNLVWTILALYHVLVREVQLVLKTKARPKEKEAIEESQIKQ